MTALVVAVFLTGCSGKKEEGKRASQTAAKVNDEEITVHQINHLLQRQHGLKPEQSEAAGRQILDRLIDQELAVQKAQELKLHRDSQVVQQIDHAVATPVELRPDRPRPAAPLLRVESAQIFSCDTVGLMRDAGRASSL